jgi:hypothetical protein
MLLHIAADVGLVWYLGHPWLPHSSLCSTYFTGSSLCLNRLLLRAATGFVTDVSPLHDAFV